MEIRGLTAAQVLRRVVNKRTKEATVDTNIARTPRKTNTQTSLINTKSITSINRKNKKGNGSIRTEATDDSEMQTETIDNHTSTAGIVN